MGFRSIFFLLALFSIQSLFLQHTSCLAPPQPLPPPPPHPEVADVPTPEPPQLDYSDTAQYHPSSKEANRRSPLPPPVHNVPIHQGALPPRPPPPPPPHPEVADVPTPEPPQLHYSDLAQYHPSSKEANRRSPLPPPVHNVPIHQGTLPPRPPPPSHPEATDVPTPEPPQLHYSGTAQYHPSSREATRRSPLPLPPPRPVRNVPIHQGTLPPRPPPPPPPRPEVADVPTPEPPQLDNSGTAQYHPSSKEANRRSPLPLPPPRPIRNVPIHQGTLLPRPPPPPPPCPAATDVRTPEPHQPDNSGTAQYHPSSREANGRSPLPLPPPRPIRNIPIHQGTLLPRAPPPTPSPPSPY